MSLESPLFQEDNFSLRTITFAEKNRRQKLLLTRVANWLLVGLSLRYAGSFTSVFLFDFSIFYKDIESELNQRLPQRIVG